MDTEKTKSLLQSAYENVQNLQLQPTKHNVTIIAAVMAALEEAFRETAAAPEEEKADV